jgi:hypothetical protein
MWWGVVVVGKGHGFQVNEPNCFASKLFSPFTFVQTVQNHNCKSMNLLETSKWISKRSKLKWASHGNLSSTFSTKKSVLNTFNSHKSWTKSTKRCLGCLRERVSVTWLQFIWVVTYGVLITWPARYSSYNPFQGYFYQGRRLCYSLCGHIFLRLSLFYIIAKKTNPPISFLGSKLRTICLSIENVAVNSANSRPYIYLQNSFLLRLGHYQDR